MQIIFVLLFLPLLFTQSLYSLYKYSLYKDNPEQTISGYFQRNSKNNSWDTNNRDVPRDIGRHFVFSEKLIMLADE